MRHISELDKVLALDDKTGKIYKFYAERENSRLTIEKAEDTKFLISMLAIVVSPSESQGGFK